MLESSDPARYYEQIVPQQLAAALEHAPANVADQPELTATYEITGPGGGTFGLRVRGTAIEFVPGGIQGSDMWTTMTIDNWRANIASDGGEPLIDYVLRRKVAVVKSLRGTVRLNLTRSDGSTFESATVFGAQAEPVVTIHMTAADYAAMMRGELNGQMAFLTGKLKFEGSLPLLMQLSALAG